MILENGKHCNMDRHIKYKDLLVTENDIVLNVVEEPTMTSDAQSIGQDIKHSIIESGLATRLIAERSQTMRIDILTQIELIAENDRRIIPGSVSVIEESQHRIFLTAKAYNYDALIKIGVLSE